MGLNDSTPKGTVSSEQGARFESNFGKRTTNVSLHSVVSFIMYMYNDMKFGIFDLVCFSQQRLVVEIQLFSCLLVRL